MKNNNSTKIVMKLTVLTSTEKTLFIWQILEKEHQKSISVMPMHSLFSRSLKCWFRLVSHNSLFVYFANVISMRKIWADSALKRQKSRWINLSSKPSSCAISVYLFISFWSFARADQFYYNNLWFHLIDFFFNRSQQHERRSWKIGRISKNYQNR